MGALIQKEPIMRRSLLYAFDGFAAFLGLSHRTSRTEPVRARRLVSEALEERYLLSVGAELTVDARIATAFDATAYLAPAEESGTEALLLSAPNLAPYKPSSWSDKIVVSNVTGTYTDTSLAAGETVYCDLAWVNSGDAAATAFYVYVYVDGSLYTGYRPSSLSAGYYQCGFDLDLGTFTQGTHTVAMTVDAASEVTESDETDNSYTRSFTVGAGVPNLEPVRLATWWDDKLVVANGTGSTSDADPLYSTDTLYANWSLENTGGAATGSSFSSALYVDGTLVNTWANDAVGASGTASVTDYSLGTLAVGTHSLQLVLDSGGTVTESDETDNSFTKTITISNFGQITGTVWNDADGDGTLDSGEAGLAGWTIYDDANCNGQYDSGETSTVSASDGTYTLTGLKAGKHYIGEGAQSGWTQTTPGGAGGSTTVSTATQEVEVSVATAATETASSNASGFVGETLSFANLPYTDPPVQESKPAAASDTKDYPTSYDLRDLGLVTSVKDQANCGSCWAFATYGALESSILLASGVTTDFSENHLKNYHDFDWWPCDGGNVSLSRAYLSRGEGPVNESDDPYHDYDDMPSPGGTPDYFVRESLTFDTRDEIKNALMTYGALHTSLYYSSSYYRSSDYTYYYAGGTGTNHAVTIVGWDDAKATAATTAGAWLIKNSWGTSWGNSGYFWLSYYDTAGGQRGYSYRNAVSASAYRHIYSYDDYGYVFGYSASYAFNAFTPTVNEDLTSVLFYTLADNATYEVKVYDTYADGTLSNQLGTTVTGTASYAGYHTIDLPTAVSLTAGDSFYVSLHLTNGGTHPLAMDGANSGYSSHCTASAGQSYYSGDGSSWTDLNSTSNSTSNFCIKALTADVAIAADHVVDLEVAQNATAANFGNHRNDAQPPTVTGVTSTAADGAYKAGAVISITVTFDEQVVVDTTGGAPTVTLETGTVDATATYSSGSGAATLVFLYTVQAGDNSADLDYVSTTALVLNGATIRDAAENDATLALAGPGAAGSLGNTKNLVIDTTAPAVTQVTSTAADGTYKAGTLLPITVTFNEAVSVTGTPTLTLETGAVDQVVNYVSRSDAYTLVFNYTVQAGDTTADLDYQSIAALLLAGGTIRDTAENDATLTLPAPGTVGSLGANKSLRIDTAAPSYLSLSPADDAIDVALDVALVVTFSENIQAGAGHLVIRRASDDAIVQTIDVTGLQVSISEAQATIAIDALDQTTGYYVEIDAGAFTDLAGNAAPALSGSAGWNFTTKTLPTLDVDGDGSADALTDGLLILRYLFDPNGQWNFSDAVGSAATRTTRAAIRGYLDAAIDDLLDVDGNGTTDALTDGLLVLRYLFDPNGAWSFADAVSPEAARTTRDELRAYLDLRNPNLTTTSRAPANAALDASAVTVAAAEVAVTPCVALNPAMVAPAATTVVIAETAGASGTTPPRSLPAVAPVLSDAVQGPESNALVTVPLAVAPVPAEAGSRGSGASSAVVQRDAAATESTVDPPTPAVEARATDVVFQEADRPPMPADRIAAVWARFGSRTAAASETVDSLFADTDAEWTPVGWRPTIRRR
jgi:C1A family cysteine protease